MSAPQTGGVGRPKRSRTLREVMTHAEDSIAAAIRGPLEAGPLIRGVLLQVAMTPALQDCDHMSILQAVMQAAALGLWIGGPAGEAALVPYQRAARLLPMTRGLITLARRADRRLSVSARLVYPDDEFLARYGTADEIVHVPRLDSAKRTDADVLHAYAVAKHDGVVIDFEIMTRLEIEAVRQVSRAAHDGPWVTWYGEQAKKSALKRLLKRFPLSPEVSAAIELDNRYETGRINEPADLLDTVEEVQARVVDQTRERTEALRQDLAAEHGGA